MHDSFSASTLAPLLRQRRSFGFTLQEWWHLAGLYGFVAILHGLGWALFLYYAAQYPALVGLGFVAYMFGLRHAFDADHIAAIDDTVRFMLQKGRIPLAVGFSFSLGHSSVVFALALAITFAATAVKQALPAMQGMGSIIGTGVSAAFLLIIGIINLFVLLDILKVWQQARTGRHNHEHLEELLARRGFMNRMFGGRLQSFITASWQMYLVGFLFGLGFDTASEVGLLAMTGGAAAGNLPLPAILSLPILFAAGMSLMDTSDGVLMCKAYNWAFMNPLRKIIYNITTTTLSITVALLIGGIEVIQVLGSALDLRGPFFMAFRQLDFGGLGYLIVGLFICAWVLSWLVWRAGRMEERYGNRYQLHTHEHVHANGVKHVHRHYH